MGSGPAERPAARSGSEEPAGATLKYHPEPTRYGDWEKKGIVSDF